MEHAAISRIIWPWFCYVTALITIAVILLSPQGNTKHQQKLIGITAVIQAVIVLVLGLKGPMVILLLTLQLVLFTDIELLLNKSGTSSSNSTTKEGKSSFHIAVMWGFFICQYFFATGHTNEFNSLHWAAAFIGFEEMNMLGGGILMTLETFASHILFVLALPVYLSYYHQNTTQKNRVPSTFSWRDAMPTLSALMLFFSFKATLTTLFVFTQRRHLMVWRVFAPKYIFEAIFLLVIDVLVLLALSLIARVRTHSNTE